MKETEFNAREIQRQDVLSGLEGYQGGTAQLWRYTASHQHLEIQFAGRSDQPNRYLVCEGCLLVAGPAFWKSVNLSVSYQEADDTFLVEDHGVGLKVVCSLILLDVGLLPGSYWSGVPNASPRSTGA